MAPQALTAGDQVCEAKPMPHRIERIALPTPSAGTRREIVAHRFGHVGARPKVYVQAALHADELPGQLVCHHLIQRLIAMEAEGAIIGEIVVVPTANPIGMSQYEAFLALERGGARNARSFLSQGKGGKHGKGEEEGEDAA